MYKLKEEWLDFEGYPSVDYVVYKDSKEVARFCFKQSAIDYLKEKNESQR